MERGRMQWSWAFWKKRPAEAARREGAPPETRTIEPMDLEDWEARLVEEGVGSEWAPRLAVRLESLHRETGRGSADLLIRSAAATSEVQAEVHAHVERNLRDVREVERLLGAFSGELEKLDEVLEVLSAYAQRMRSQPARKSRHTLH